jgi:prepilin signal peptidase PulO-like enzyme (type II secretory pathway)
MIIVPLVVLGLALGSFVNALVWRVHEQEHEARKKSPDKEYLKKLSVSKGRSMCPDCKHELKTKDLVPVFSWLSTGGKCRYCSKPISKQYPLVELATAAAFVASYLWWPEPFSDAQKAIFAFWLLVLTGLMALLVYDARWKLLPNRIMYPLGWIAAIMAMLVVASADSPLKAFVNVLLAVLVCGGIFYGLFQVSKGKWIGGGDVKLGWLLGLVVATPAKAFLFIFLASVLGTVFSLPLMASNKLKRDSTIPFGPFLIIAAFLVLLFGSDFLDWYKNTFINI